jgi:hypothetical protein
VEIVTTGEQRGKTHAFEGGRIRVATDVDADAFLQRFSTAVGIRYIKDADGTRDSE